MYLDTQDGFLSINFIHFDPSIKTNDFHHHLFDTACNKSTIRIPRTKSMGFEWSICSCRELQSNELQERALE